MGEHHASVRVRCGVGENLGVGRAQVPHGASVQGIDAVVAEEVGPSRRKVQAMRSFMKRAGSGAIP